MLMATLLIAAEAAGEKKEHCARNTAALAASHTAGCNSRHSFSCTRDAWHFLLSFLWGVTPEQCQCHAWDPWMCGALNQYLLLRAVDVAQEGQLTHRKLAQWQRRGRRYDPGASGDRQFARNQAGERCLLMQEASSRAQCINRNSRVDRQIKLNRCFDTQPCSALPTLPMLTLVWCCACSCYQHPASHSCCY